MEQHHLQKNIGLSTAVATVVGSVIGAGVFFKPYAIYQATGGAPGMGMLAWILGGIASILAALTFAEVAVMIPKTGGMVAYLSAAYGEKVGFLAGWMQVIIFYPAFMAGYIVKVGEELTPYLGQGAALPVGLAVIGLLVAINIMGNRVAGGIQQLSTVCKLIPLGLIMVFGFLLGSGDNPVMTPLVAEGTGFGSALGATLMAVLFAFEGWTNVGAMAGEMKDPGRDLPRAIIGGVSILMAVYFLINLAYLWVLPAEEMMALPSPAAAVAEQIFGKAGGGLIRAGIIISVLGAGNGFLMTGSRVAYELAHQGTLPFSGRLRKVNGSGAPVNAVLLIAGLACLFSLSGQFDRLTDLAVFSCWIFYTLTFLCVMKLRRTMPEAERKYKVPGYPAVPVLAVASGLYVVVSQLFLSGTGATMMSIGSIAVTLLGLPVYKAMKGKK